MSQNPRFDRDDAYAPADPEHAAELTPIDVDGVGVVTVGTILWAVAALVLLPFHQRLSDDGNLWVIWTCVAGFGLGLLGLWYCRKRRDALALIRQQTQ